MIFQFIQGNVGVFNMRIVFFYFENEIVQVLDFLFFFIVFLEIFDFFWFELLFYSGGGYLSLKYKVEFS